MLWEYMTIDKFVNLQELNRLGASGWELVTIEQHDHEYSTDQIFYFKRPIRPQPFSSGPG